MKYEMNVFQIPGMRVLCKQNECPICRRLNQKVSNFELFSDVTDFRIVQLRRLYSLRKSCHIVNWIKRTNPACTIRHSEYASRAKESKTLSLDFWSTYAISMTHQIVHCSYLTNPTIPFFCLHYSDVISHFQLRLL